MANYRTTLLLYMANYRTTLLLYMANYITTLLLYMANYITTLLGLDAYTVNQDHTVNQDRQLTFAMYCFGCCNRDTEQQLGLKLHRLPKEEIRRKYFENF